MIRMKMKPKCLACHKELSLFSRLARHRFCSEQHEQAYMAELEELALERLGCARATLAVVQHRQRVLNSEEEARHLENASPLLRPIA